MALIDRVKERTGSDLSDTELQSMIDAINVDLDARFGVLGEVTIELGDPTDPNSRQVRTLRLQRPVDTEQPITIVEIAPSDTGEASDEITLSANDYRVLHSGRTLQRLSLGANPAQFWAPMVQLTYTPISNLAQREEVTIKLVQLDLSYRGGLKSEKAGDYSFTLSGDQTADREAILQSLEDRRGMMLA
ncbi:MAG: hypothetical protein AAF707_00115 [Pseudomonadota bacterium]